MQNFKCTKASKYHRRFYRGINGAVSRETLPFLNKTKLLIIPLFIYKTILKHQEKEHCPFKNCLFLERGITSVQNLSETGSKVGGLGGTHPPKTNSRTPPPPGSSVFLNPASSTDTVLSVVCPVEEKCLATDR